jgi:hypothetical protein
MTTENSPKSRQIFCCEKCDYTCSKRSDYDKHCYTRKHKNTTFGEKIQPKSRQTIECCCGKQYYHRSSLFNHRKTCSISINKNSTNFIQDNNLTDSDTVQLLIKENTDFKFIIMDLVKSNTELQKQLIDVCKNSNTTINNTNNNSHNKTFNLQFFLNEQCKDAMNISEFVNTFDLQLSDLESVGELGYVEGITKQIINKLNGMDIYKRPMHCSDAKREILYVKDEDKWEREKKNNPKLRKAIKNISFNNMKLVGKWSDTYPESKLSESRLNDKYMKLVKQTTGGNGEITDSEDKIIRRIAKEIIIDK